MPAKSTSILIVLLFAVVGCRLSVVGLIILATSSAIIFLSFESLGEK